ncbi:PQQ-dependent sugar dehydrogenase [Arenibaculum pallidiluteum]|uniref:PQQ-dependent sugar dehydrogenase n=1 Tax=Arenibaculum pallidiluteum TaxID=2812559 RepID=UPI001A96FA6C|nr:PQQ-dependent sugar dehydrogenase [Arenibaculum pallidiluteum]
MTPRSLLPILAAAMLATAPAHAQTAGARAQETIVGSGSTAVRVETLASGLQRPWGLAFLPDGRMLVTERTGSLRIVSRDSQLSEPVAGVPQVVARGQGGLLDVALDPDFATNRLVYLTYSEPGEGGASTAVARGRLEGGRLEQVQVIFRQLPKVDGNNHFGSRLAFAPDGTLFVGLGERFKFDPAQDPASHLGKVVRINRDGSVPQGNPFAGRGDARPEIWSLGHRNIQAAGINPATGELWVVEHGPRGGDEVNVAEAGRNYGWPLVSWGRHYDGTDIPDPPSRPELAQPIHQWTPVIGASGMAFYGGDLFPEWKGDMLVGGLVSRGIVRLDFDGRRLVSEDRLDLGARIRDVRQGPDGAVYALTDSDSGRILRLSPAGEGGVTAR